eukprot:6884339-Karenia_brevis.AAC.1
MDDASLNIMCPSDVTDNASKNFEKKVADVTANYDDASCGGNSDVTDNASKNFEEEVADVAANYDDASC